MLNTSARTPGNPEAQDPAQRQRLYREAIKITREVRLRYGERGVHGAGVLDYLSVRLIGNVRCCRDDASSVRDVYHAGSSCMP